MTRHMFAGAGTPEGFVSFFGGISAIEKTEKAIILKGSSGSGKSTFIKKIGKACENENYDVDYLHCSNDADSLDGVYVPSLRAYVVDGTAPHVSDPIIPAGVEQIFNMGEFIDASEIKANKRKLLSMIAEKTELQKHANNYLKAAKSVYNNNSLIYERVLNKSALNKKISKITETIKTLPANSNGANRRFFASAITPKGLKNFIDTILHGKVFVLNAKDGMGADIMLAEIQETANRRGHDTESFYCPLKPSKIEHLTVPQLKLSYTTANEFHKPSVESGETINFEELCSSFSEHREEMEFNDNLFEMLLKKTMETMKASLMVHESVEKIYITAMDFKRLDEACQNLRRKFIYNC